MNVQYISTKPNDNHYIPLFHNLTETKSYIPISSSLLDYIITTTELSSIEKIFYILADCLALINANSGKKRNITLSAEGWAKRLGCSASKIFDLQKSLEKKGFFQIIRKKNEHKQNNRNSITPTVPNNIFKYLSLSSKKNTTNEYYSFDSSKESKRDYLDRTDYFFKFNYGLLKIVISNKKLTSTQKIIFFDLYIRAYSNYKITQKLLDRNISNNNNSIQEDNFYLVSSYLELQKKYSCSSSALSKNLHALQKAGFITRSQIHTLKNSLDGQRKDKSLWKITVTMPDDSTLELSNLKDRSIIKKTLNNDLLKIEDNPHIFPYPWGFNYSISYSDPHISYKPQILNNIPLNIINTDYIDANSQNFSLFYSSNLSVFFKNSFFDKNIINSVQTIPIIPKLTFLFFENSKEKEGKNDKVIDKISFLNKSRNRKDNISQTKYEKTASDVEIVETKELNDSPYTTNSKNSKTLPKNNIKTDKKTFKDFHPLSDKLAASLNRRANREFSTNFTNQLLLKFINKYPDKIFANPYCFYSYMIKALRYEKHDAYLVNHETFNLSININEEQKEINKKQQYLAKIESSSYTTRSAHLEKKISARFETNLAYSLLTECEFEMKQEYELEKGDEQYKEEMIEISEYDIKIAREARKLITKYQQEYGTENDEIDLDKVYQFKEFTDKQLKEIEKKYELRKDNIIVQKDKGLEEIEQTESVILHNVMVISLSKTVILTDLDKRLLEDEIKAVYGNVNTIYKYLKDKVTNYNNDYQKERIYEEEKDYSPLWQKIRAELKAYFGENWLSLDKAWFSKLEAEIDKNTGNIVIKASTNFIKDWVKNKYLRFLEKSCQALNLELDRYKPIIVNNDVC